MAGLNLVLGVILIGFAIMFLCMGINPDLNQREITYCEKLEEKGHQFYDRRNKNVNCKRICKGNNPLLWWLPI